MIDLRRLTVLRAIEQYGTVTAAAGAVHLTPSAVSQQVRQLGRELGVTLLKPQGRRVRLTEAAQALLRHADSMEELWQRAEAELHATAVGEPSGVLRVAGFPTAASALLVPLAVRLQQQWSALTVKVREAEPLDCFDLLFSGETDLAVVEAMTDNPPLDDGRFDQRPLLDDPFDLITTAGHEVREPGPALEDLASEPWIIGMPGVGCSARQLVLAACRSAGFAPSVAHEARRVERGRHARRPRARHRPGAAPRPAAPASESGTYAADRPVRTLATLPQRHTAGQRRPSRHRRRARSADGAGREAGGASGLTGPRTAAP
ncbi:LysR family transcriptional regulator [Streptomyces marispadix]|uniref:LysR family transcriptional regulator n=1 Tax=Streptomyces marispadix TaxID=2922868 RepID=UPI003FD71BF5